MDEIELQRAADRLVQNEVNCCLSSIVSTLAKGYPTFSHNMSTDAPDFDGLCEQAFELASPVDDYEEAARQADFIERDGKITTKEEAGDGQHEWDSWQEACDSEGIDPYQWEVHEHWAVSQWLAEKLIEAGEKVDTDFAGLNVWARATTGQAISMDAVIRRIVQELHKAEA